MLGIWPFTGAFADVGPLLDRGMRLANRRVGRKSSGADQVHHRDDETKGAAPPRRMEEAIDSEGVKSHRPWSSGIALACPKWPARKVFYYFSGGTRTSRQALPSHAFNWAASPFTPMHVVVRQLHEAQPTHKRWYMFVNDYAFGWSVEKYPRGRRRLGIEFVGSDRMPLGTASTPAS